MPTIILKFDDVKSKTRDCPMWNGVLDFLMLRKIKSSAGVIGRFLNEDDPKMIDWIKKTNSTGYVEFWNHGYYHPIPNVQHSEFFNKSVEEQCFSLKHTQKLGRNKCEIHFSTFGAPYNKIDNNTITALKQFPNIKILFYKFEGIELVEPSIFTIKIKKRYEETYESPDKKISYFTLSYDTFVKRYNSLKTNTKDDPYEVLQFHPGGWKEDCSVYEFSRIIDYLLEIENAKFVTPTEYRNTALNIQ